MSTNGMRVRFYAERIEGVAKGVVQRVLADAGSTYTNDVKLLMRNSPRGGAGINMRGQRRSAPGEAPAPETSKLLQSVRYRVSAPGADEMFMEAGSTVDYAPHLEFGAARFTTKTASGRGAGMPAWILFPRPAWGPAMNLLRRKLPGIIRRAGEKPDAARQSRAPIDDLGR